MVVVFIKFLDGGDGARVAVAQRLGVAPGEGGEGVAGRRAGDIQQLVEARGVVPSRLVEFVVDGVDLARDHIWREGRRHEELREDVQGLAERSW